MRSADNMLADRAIRILIIEDDRTDREIYKRCLRLSAPWRFEFAESDSAVAGIEMAKTWRPDCILLDYNLPDQDGLEVLNLLKRQSGQFPCAVVMLTAFGGEELAVKAMKAGVMEYIPKGRVDADNLPHAIINAVEKFQLQARIEEQRTALERSDRRNRLLLEAIPQMVWMANAGGELAFANRRWLEYAGLNLDQATRLGWEELLHPADRERTWRTWSEAERTGSVFEIEHRLRKSSDGSYRWHLVRAVPMKNESDEVTNWFGTCTDIEDQKQAEDAVHQRQKFESIGRLAGGVAHDFNNLLVSILGGASIAMDSLPPSHPAQRMLEGVVSAGERAAQLTRRMLAYAGKANLFVEPVDLGQLLETTCEQMRSSLPASVHLELQTGAYIPPVETDLAQLRQVLADLVTNAVEAIGENGPGTVVVRTDVVDLDGESDGLATQQAASSRIAVEVQDTGCGMDEETQKKIFDPFFTTKSTGRGLGLAAVQGFVRSNGGSIEVSSMPGKGTRLRLLLPTALERVRSSSGHR